MMKGLLLKAGKGDINAYANVVEFEDKLDSYYSLLDCEYIEAPERTIGGKWFCLVCDEEGLLKGNPVPCCQNVDYDEVICGNVLVVGMSDDDGNFTSITDEDVELIMDNIVAAFTRDGDLVCITCVGLQ